MSQRGDGSWRYFAMTTVLCIAIALALWGIGLTSPLWATFVVSFCIGYSVHGTHEILFHVFGQNSNGWLTSISATAIGLIFGLGVSGFFVSGDPLYFFGSDRGTLFVGAFFGFIGMAIFANMSRLAEAKAELADAQARNEAQQRTMLATQLQALQAQIEPHFLFNTLSNISGMIRTNPEGAESTLEHLTTLLRATLKRTREQQTTLADEAEILSSYLAIQSMRMGTRLQFDIEMPTNARSIELAPLLLQPIVENAVLHGIDPLEEGGRVAIQASVTDDELRIEISDNGQGISSAPTKKTAGGVGLSNVRDRLKALYGERASLRLESPGDGGTIARLVIPLDENSDTVSSAA
ncbi:MAG: sensor histidine kinase [Pseudomonadaceae bacterium]|nr:sensor histidine kinase [Pseudomonadaceae bacterium]